MAARGDRLRGARRALEPPPLHGRSPGPRPVGDRRVAGCRGGRPPCPGRRPRRDHDPDHRAARPRVRGDGPRRLGRGDHRPRRGPPARRADGRAPTAVARAVGPGRDRPSARRRSPRCRPVRRGAGRIGGRRRRGLPLSVPRHGRSQPPRARRPARGGTVGGDGRGSRGRAGDSRDAARNRPRPRPRAPGPGLDRQGPGGARVGARRLAGSGPGLGGDLGGDRPGPLPGSIEPARRSEPDRRGRPRRGRCDSGRRPWLRRQTRCSPRPADGASPRSHGPR